MRFSLRNKLGAIIAATALGFAFLTVAGQIFSQRVQERLAAIERVHIPRLELGLRLENELARLERVYAEAVSAADPDAIHRVGVIYEAFATDLDRAKGAVRAEDADALRRALVEYRSIADDVSSRLIAGDGGPATLDAMVSMEERHAALKAAIQRATELDSTALTTSFVNARQTQVASQRFTLITAVSCLAAVIALALMLSSGIVRSLRELADGFARFGRGELDAAIVTSSKDELGDLARVANAMADSLRKAQQGLLEKAEELASISKYKSQFLANTSHELRTPLNSMLLLSKHLAMNPNDNLDARQIEYAQTIYTAGQSLLVLINDILDLARIEAGRQQVHLSTFALRELLQRLEWVFKPLAQDKGLVLVFTVRDDVPRDLTSDAQRLEQVVGNLIGNAIKFTKTGSVQVTVSTASDVIEFAITDTGIGIAPEHRQRIFQPFEQVDLETNRTYGGTGLGLSIARDFAFLLGGEIRVVSELGRGSTFTCRVPMRLDTHAERPGQSPPP